MFRVYLKMRFLLLSDICKVIDGQMIETRKWRAEISAFKWRRFKLRSQLATCESRSFGRQWPCKRPTTTKKDLVDQIKHIELSDNKIVQDFHGENWLNLAWKPKKSMFSEGKSVSYFCKNFNFSCNDRTFDRLFRSVLIGGVVKKLLIG